MSTEHSAPEGAHGDLATENNDAKPEMSDRLQRIERQRASIKERYAGRAGVVDWDNIGIPHLSEN